MLLQTQAILAEKVASGIPAAEAYQQAHPNAAKSTCKQTGPRLIKENKEIAARIAEIRAGAAESARLKATEKMYILEEIATEGKDRDKIAAVSELNQMSGDRAATNQQITVSPTSRASTGEEIDLGRLTIQELQEYQRLLDRALVRPATGPRPQAIPDLIQFTQVLPVGLVQAVPAIQEIEAQAAQYPAQITPEPINIDLTQVKTEA